MVRIVVYTHHYKRPPPKKKAPAVKITAALVVHAPKAAGDERETRQRPHVRTFRIVGTPSRQPLPAVVVATSEKRLKLLRAERWAAQPREPSPEIQAFFARNVRPGGPRSE